MTDIANLQIKVDTSQLDKASKSLRSVNNTAETTTRTTGRATKALNSLTGAFAGLVTAAGAFKAIQVADKFTLLEARVKNSTRSVEEFEKSFDRLRELSAKTGASFQSAVEVFQRISFVRDEINATSEEMVRFTANVQKLGVVSGASTGALNAGLTQLGQGLSSGVLRAEELNSVLENTPSIAVAISKEFGVTTGQLRNLVLEGEVLSKDVFAAILNQTEDINKQFSKFPETVGRAFNNLTLQLQNSVKEMDNLTGGSKILIEGIRIAGQVLQSFVGLLQGFGNILKAFFTTITAGIIDTFNQATKALEETINLAIRGINLLKKEDIGLVSISTDIDRSALAKTAADQAKKEVQQALKGFEAAFEGVAGIFEREQALETEKQQTNELSKNYKEIAENLKSAKEETKETEKETKKLAKTVDRDLGGSFNQLTTEIERDFARAFKDAFSSTEGGFNRLVSGMKASFQNFLGEIAFQASKGVALRIIPAVLGGGAGLTAGAGAASAGGGSLGSIGNLLGGLGGGTGGGGLGGLGVSGNIIGGSGFSPFLSDIGFGLGNLLGGGQTFLSAGFGNAGFGALGGLGANLLGLGGGIGGTIGGTLGSVVGGGAGASVGSILGLAGGPVGAALGGFLGTAVGGLFGGDKDFPFARADLNTQGGRANIKRTLELDGGPRGDVRKLGEAVNEVVNRFAEEIGASGISGGGTKIGVASGRSSALGSGFFVGGRGSFNGGAEFTNIKSAEKAAELAATDFLKNASFQGLKSEVQNIVKQSFNQGKSADETLQAVQAFRAQEKAAEQASRAREEAAEQAEQQFKEAFERFINPDNTSNPLQQALKQLRNQFDALKEKAQELNIPINGLTEAFDRQRETIIQQTFRPIQDFLNNQALSGDSSLSPVNKLSLSRSLFEESLGAVRGGEVGRINELTQRASSLLDIGRNVFASGEGFASLERFVRQSVAGVPQELGFDAGISEELVVNSAEQTSLLRQMNAQIEELRTENKKLRKSFERFGNAATVT